MSGKRQRGVQMNENTGGKGFVFLGVSKGLFTQRVDEPIEGVTKSRALGEKSPNAGKIIHELMFNEVTGILLDIKIKEGKYGKSWEFYIDTSTDDNDEITVIQTNYSSGYAGGILKRLPNVDLTDDILFYSYNFTPKGENKPRVGITLKQWDDSTGKYKSIPAFFTKKNPNGLPQLEQIEVNGQKQWDSSKQMAYLLNMVESQIKPNLEGIPDKDAAPKTQAPKIETTQPDNHIPPGAGADFSEECLGEEGEDDDLPF